MIVAIIGAPDSLRQVSQWQMLEEIGGFEVSTASLTSPQKHEAKTVAGELPSAALEGSGLGEEAAVRSWVVIAIRRAGRRGSSVGRNNVTVATPKASQLIDFGPATRGGGRVTPKQNRWWPPRPPC